MRRCPLKRSLYSWAKLALLAPVLAAFLFGTGCGRGKIEPVHPNRFELVREHMAGWLVAARADLPVKPADYLKGTIIDDWENKKEDFQIISVRSAADFDSAGHIPHAVNIHWKTLVDSANLQRVHPAKTKIVYCYTGHTGQTASTILGLLGHDAYNLKFGMMDWNLDALDLEPWDMDADHDVETGINLPEGAYPLPELRSIHSEAEDVILEAAVKYLHEAVPVIKIAEVKDIVDNWESHY